MGFVDLHNLAIRSGITVGTSLAGLTNQIAGFHLKKSKSVTRSNWNANALSTAQVNYAAGDAIAAMLIMEQLVADKLAQDRAAVSWTRKAINALIVPRDSSKSVLETDEGVACMYSLCQGLVNLHRQVGWLKPYYSHMIA